MNKFQKDIIFKELKECYLAGFHYANKLYRPITKEKLNSRAEDYARRSFGQLILPSSVEIKESERNRKEM